MSNKTWYIECSCHSPEHMMVFNYDSDNGDLYITYQLYQFNGFLKRLWLAFKYLFNFRSENHWDCTLLFDKDVGKIQEWLDSGASHETRHPSDT